MLVVFLICSEGNASPIFEGDFESGDISQWSASQHVPGGVAVVTSPVDGGQYAARFTLRSGDRPFQSQNSERAELVYFSNETEGSSSWWAWSMYLPQDFHVKGGWNVFTQWHQNSLKCPSPVSFVFEKQGNRTKFFLVVRGGEINWDTCVPQAIHKFDLGFVKLEKWHRFVCHIVWQPSGGRFEVWLDGRQVVSELDIPNIYKNESVYFKQGLYRAYGGDVTLFFDNVRYGFSQTDVTK